MFRIKLIEFMNILNKKGYAFFEMNEQLKNIYMCTGFAFPGMPNNEIN
jgi:hypothetical protein